MDNGKLKMIEIFHVGDVSRPEPPVENGLCAVPNGATAESPDSYQATVGEGLDPP